MFNLRAESFILQLLEEPEIKIEEPAEPVLATMEGRFNFGPFFFWTAAQFAVVVGLFAWLMPAMFRQELSMPLQIVGWTFALGLPLSLFEYLYHRYLLHSAVLPFLGIMHQCHSDHHGLTNVKAPVSPKTPDKLVEVDSRYPIVHEHQEESMQFPLFAISIFFVIFLVLLAVPAKLIWPDQPVVLATICTATLSYGLYEFWHAILHLPFDKYWQPAMNHRVFGKLVRYTYGFHLMHHWRPTTNLAVVGFWGIAIWDHLFRTHRRPENMPLDKAQVSYNDAKIARPIWPISLLDKWQPGMYKGSRKIERSLAKLFGIK